ncbi:endonuclease domain-containing protein [Hymenobacter metallicola]|uniref:Endonuclease domain-containing protein n=1 Tax=Hymenobacter metallicola TaxID=2563114 RepID=A0A4Z0QGL7_9BACT|nr:endonuclease domain-containing protein [Hymenobacter metallicola]TGE28181.1 endonuclease domain-containing protein [Hymenobacter metallicola]
METNDSYLPQDRIFTADKKQYGKLDLRGRARSMRHAPTPAEEVLWQRLRGNQLGVKFRRQHSIDRYIADFVCLSHKLIVELDGPGHQEPNQAEYDQGRSQTLTGLGYCILRFSNEQAIHETEVVLQTIKANL